MESLSIKKIIVIIFLIFAFQIAYKLDVENGTLPPFDKKAQNYSYGKAYSSRNVKPVKYKNNNYRYKANNEYPNRYEKTYHCRSSFCGVFSDIF